MLKRIPDVSPGIDALAAVGTVTGEDYEQTIEPLFDEARRSNRPLRLLLQIGPEYEGYTAGVLWEKTATVFRSHPLLRLFDGYAAIQAGDVQAMDVRWTPKSPIVAATDNGTGR